MKAVNPSQYILARCLLSPAEVEFLIGLVFTQKTTLINYFQKSVNQTNLLTTEKPTPSWQGIAYGNRDTW